MASSDSTQSFGTFQPPKSGYGFLAAILDGLNDQPVLDALQSYRHTGRPGYPVQAMWRAYLVKFLLKIRYSNALLERLRGSRRLREVCGFGADIPSERAMSRFTSRLADHEHLVQECLHDTTNALEPSLPGFGNVTAIDSTLFPTYSNPNQPVVSDQDAQWGVKNSAKAKDGKKEWMFGYKMHLISDTTYGLPLDFIITPANESDSTMLPPVVQQARETYPWLKPKFLMADKGYDALSNHEYLVKQKTIPVIHLRKPKEGTLHDGIYDEKGSPTCQGMVSMNYVRTDKASGHHLFRCPPEGCDLKNKGSGAVRYCNSETWENPADNLRVIGIIPRASKTWKKLYAHRMSVERVFRSLKHSRGLAGHCARGMRKILLQSTMSVLTFQATVLARVRAGDMKNMRQMNVKVS